MKKLAGMLFLGLLAFGCGKEPTAPGRGERYRLIGSRTVGPEGGTLAAEDISVAVPPGAFGSDAEVKLYVSEERPFGENGVSKTFKLEVPEEYSRPLKVRIRSRGALSGESFVAVGEETFVPSLGEVRTTYDLFPASDSSGYLTCELPVPEGGRVAKAAGGTGFSISLLAVSGYYTYTSKGGHFRINFPAHVLDQAYDLADYLEEAYATFKDMGFSYAARTRWPVSVTVKDLGEEVYGYSVCSIWGNNYGYMEFNARKMEERDQMRLTAGHEFFHLVQSLYDPRNRIFKAKGWFYTHYWLDEATAVWSEEKFTSEEDYRSPVREGNELAPFHGMQAGAAKEPKDHGYGMSAVIKYLVERYGEGVLVDMYKKIRGGAHPVEALVKSLDDPVSLWWPDFFREYLEGRIYGVGIGTFVAGKSGSFSIRSDSDVLKTFSGSYPDLSAKIYLVELLYPEIDESAKIEFVADSPDIVPYLMVFKFDKQGKVKYLASSVDSLTISDVRALTDEGWHLLVAVVDDDYNPPDYAKTADVRLRVRVVTLRTFGELWKGTIEWDVPDTVRVEPTVWEAYFMPTGGGYIAFYCSDGKPSGGGSCWWAMNVGEEIKIVAASINMRGKRISEAEAGGTVTASNFRGTWSGRSVKVYETTWFGEVWMGTWSSEDGTKSGTWEGYVSGTGGGIVSLYKPDGSAFGLALLMGWGRKPGSSIKGFSERFFDWEGTRVSEVEARGTWKGSYTWSGRLISVR